MNWFLLLTFVALIFLVRVEVYHKPRLDWDKENKRLLLWYTPTASKYYAGKRENIRLI